MNNKQKIYIFDSTLRDGAQGQGISFSVDDKIKICKILDSLNIDYIEAGNPASNPKDVEFFNIAKELNLKNSKLIAFGSTRKARIKVEEDNNLKSLIKADVKVVTLFGKSSKFHVENILKTNLEENLNMIKESIEYLINQGIEVIFDGEHFFDGYIEDKEYALKSVLVAQNSGAKAIVLCDTNGGMLPNEIFNIVKDVKSHINVQLGIHCHNDMGLAVANSINAINAGANHVQGTFLGVGERCGNTNLSTIVPILKFKLGLNILNDNAIKNLTSVCRYISEISNLSLRDDLPYVGSSAFAHKGGMHIDAVLKDSKSYEHISPDLVGNSRRFLVSEVSGKSTIVKEVQKIFPKLSKDSKEVTIITDKLKELEYEGYQFEGAEGSIELVIRKVIGKYKSFFTLKSFKVIGEQPSHTGNFSSTAIINIEVDGKSEVTAAEGEGPVHALDKSLRKALEVFYPQLKEVKLIDYKVRVLDTNSGTDSKVRVLIESTDGREIWSTIGVSQDIIGASWIALVDSIEYKLIKDIEKSVKMFFL